MGFTTSILPVFVVLAIGLHFPQQSNSLELQHHRTIREESSVCPISEFIIYQAIKDNCFYFSTDNNADPMNWRSAKDACKKLGTIEKPTPILAEFGKANDCESDELLMEAIVTKGHEVWLGATDLGQDSQWAWVSNGRPLSLLNSRWGPYQPNNYLGPQNCLATLKRGDQTPERQYFNDEACNTTMAYVCQVFN